ncbi:MAG: hypothetical protein SOW08_13070 [Lachnospiraceae bacterium]|nr:hypothetical protein [Lachnospiraceae bacterium]
MNDRKNKERVNEQKNRECVNDQRRSDYMHEIDYPDPAEIRRQMDLILDRGLPVRRSLQERLLALYRGPGLRVIFYRSNLAAFMSGLIYAGMLALCGYLRDSVEYAEYLLLLVFPMFYFAFSALSYWSEEQEEVVELKQTLRYSFTYIVSLRMFYTAIVSVLADCLLFMAVKDPGTGGKLLAVGFSSTFLFALLSVFLYNHIGNYYHIVFMAVCWAAVCCLLSRYGGGVSWLLFEVIPFTVHGAVALGCMVCFVFYIGKVGENNAYTYSCQ